MVAQAFRKDYAIKAEMVSIRMRRNAIMSNIPKKLSFTLLKNKNDKMEWDGDAKMYAAFSCADCGQEFESCEELEEHERTALNKLSE
jgi:hypothetical protein